MSTDGTEHQDHDQADTGGEGPEGTIPSGEDGVAAGATEEASHFEPEEDEGDGA
ncbi:hypothetical protein [Arthrobacter bussei]|jgi:hypothetical protein|uniref:hypothetical protein n=1 Tax=Arthrobacter bussei TaxID=2594179 RepID=UPI0017808F54|nr:hypothetical protein [Arthrobacter bussei]